MLRALTAAGLAALTLAGCGGQSDQQQIRSNVNQFTVDVGQGRYSAACHFATGQAASAICGLAKAGGPLTAAQCSQVGPNSTLGQACASSQTAITTLSGLTSLVISKVVVSGSSATVAFTGSSEVMQVSKVNGRWLVSSD